MKKILALVLAALMLFSVFTLFGCQKTIEKDKGAIIQMYLTDFPTSLDPAAIAYGSAEQVISNLLPLLNEIYNAYQKQQNETLNENI